jgi:hypothetical protein
MKDSSRLLVGLALSLLALAAIMPTATAGRTMGIGVDNKEGFSFQRPGTYHVTLRVVVWPLWYFVEDLDTYSKVTLNLTLHRVIVNGYGSQPIISSNNCASLPNSSPLGLVFPGAPSGGLQCTWSNVHLSQDEDGVTLDATLYLQIDVVVSPDAAVGLYYLALDGMATAPGLSFEGDAFATMLVY